MTYKERIERENGNTDCVYAYSDGGLFYNFYDRSAYVLHTKVRQFKTHVKTLKGLPEPYIKLGFPVSKKEEYLAPLGEVSEPSDDHSLTVRLKEPIDLEGYKKWRNIILLEDMRERNKTSVHDERTVPSTDGIHIPEEKTEEPSQNNTLKDFADEVLSLNIATMTPMEALLFLNGLQQRLRDGKDKQQ